MENLTWEVMKQIPEGNGINTKAEEDLKFPTQQKLLLFQKF